MEWTAEGRVEQMRDFPIIQCPDWCTRQVDEGNFEQHISQWATVLDGTEDGEKVVVLARARREWWNGEGPEGESPAWVELAFHGAAAPSKYESEPEIRDAVAYVFLSGGDLAVLFDNCDPLRAMAAMEGHDWEWAYDGAEDDADEEDADA